MPHALVIRQNKPISIKKEETKIGFDGYLKDVLKTSDRYLKKVFSPSRYSQFLKEIQTFDGAQDTKETIQCFIKTYERFIKEDYQLSSNSNRDQKLMDFIENKGSDLKIVWGDCLEVLKRMDSESIHLMVTSPPYYNAREYSQWNNLNKYLEDMRKIINESYRVLDNHRVFIFNIGDVFDNDNLTTKSVWGSRRLPLGAYFIKIFEECGFTFVDNFIWDKGEVQSQRHKHENKPYPFYQYPLNCYEHILIFHKHRLDKTKFPCPVCGSLKVNGNTQSEIGLQSWECKNYDCFERSKSNRGKRFSLKTNLTQMNQIKENEIDLEIIKKWRRDIVKFSPVIKIASNGENRLGHTAPFPKDIPEMAIKYFTYVGDKVLDPFAGSFTTAIVAKELNRVGLGIEINKKTFRDAIIKRIRHEFKQLSFLTEYDLSTGEIKKYRGICLDDF